MSYFYGNKTEPVMKKMLLSFACVLCTPAFGQDGFFLQPVIGAGITNIKRVGAYNQTGNGNDISFDGGILAGYRAGRWIYSTGLVYLRTGTKLPITIVDGLGNPIGSSSIIYRFSHLMLPVTAGRSFRMSKRLSLTPSAGVGISYNISESEKNSLYNVTTHMPASEFNNAYHQFGFFGLVQAELAYKVSKAVSITCAPSFDYMLTNMAKPPDFIQPNYVQHNYALLLNVGIRYQPHRKEKHPGKV